MPDKNFQLSVDIHGPYTNENGMLLIKFIVCGEVVVREIVGVKENGDYILKYVDAE